MKLEGTYTFDAPRELVWEMLQDPAVLAKVMPGCQKLEKVGENSYAGKLKIKVGPVQGVFKGAVQLSDLQAPHSYVMDVDGKGPAGIVKGKGQVFLEEEEAQTIMRYTGDANVSGRIASVGQRLMDSSAKAITKQSLENLDKQVQARVAPTAEPAPAPTPATTPSTPTQTTTANATPTQPVDVPPPSQTEFALGVAKDVANDFVPEEQQKYLLLGAGLLAVYLFFNWWTNLIARRVAKQLKEG